MTTFDKRQEGFERKFAHDEEMKFKVEAKRNKLLGEWAAQKFALPDDQVENYIKEIIRADFQEAGDEDVFRKLRADFTTRNIDISDQQIRDTMKEMTQKAIALIAENS